MLQQNLLVGQKIIFSHAQLFHLKIKAKNSDAKAVSTLFIFEQFNIEGSLVCPQTTILSTIS